MPPTYATADGSIRLYLADCLTVLPTLEAGSVDAVVTDPPYGVGYDLGNETDDPANRPNVLAALDLCQSSTLLAFGTLNHYELKSWDWRWAFIWHKPMTRATPAWGVARHYELIHWYTRDGAALQPCETMSDVIAANPPIFRVNPETVAHPAQKPTKLLVMLLRAFKPTAVLDPFMGSGTTGVACIRTGRRFIGIEREPKYFRIAVKRIEAELARHPLLEPPPLVQRTFEP